MIERYESLVKTLKPRKIFELGIQRGGSCVFFQSLSEADKLVAIEISDKPVPAVDEYIAKNKLEDTLRPYYGVDQADMARLREIVSKEFKGEEIDLVIDDASHFLDETRNSFNALFPYVRPGGAYVIEDWPWAHAKIDGLDDGSALWPEREPMTKLIFELILACPSTHSYIDQVVIDRNSATVWRGKNKIEPEGFDISKCSVARGRDLIS
jgi:cephalosporin hydroxylase